MREPRRNFFDDAEDLAGPPAEGIVATWGGGLILPIAAIGYGLYCIVTGEATIPNFTLGPVVGGIARTKVVQDAAATSLGLVLCFVGCFAHFHWFWGNHRRLCRYYEPAQVVALVGLIPSLAWFLYSIAW
jgi:hypothetical protein